MKKRLRTLFGAPRFTHTPMFQFGFAIRARALTRSWPKNCRYGFPDAEPDLRRRAFLHHDRAGHSGADQYAGWYVRQVDADRNALCQSDPGECGVDSPGVRSIPPTVQDGTNRVDSR